MELNIQERGTMLSSYFCGTPGVMLPINIDKKTTCSEVLKMLKEEIDQVWDHIEYTAEHHGYNPNCLDENINEQLDFMEDYILEKGTKDKPYNSDLDFTFDDLDEDEQDLPVAIFTIEFKED